MTVFICRRISVKFVDLVVVVDVNKFIKLSSYKVYQVHQVGIFIL